MKNIFQTKLDRTKVLLYSSIAVALILIVIVPLGIFPKNKPSISRLTSTKTVQIQESKIVMKDTATPYLRPTDIPTNKILGIKTTYISPTPKGVSEIKPTSAPAQVNNSSTPSTVPTSVPTASPASPTTAPVVTSTVNMEIKAPDSSVSFSVELHDGMNVCDVLQKAKDDGKVSSVTFDDSYMSSLHSKYVYEINGYKNNWTFTVNGNSSLGCSLSNPKPNDTIIWKFL